MKPNAKYKKNVFKNLNLMITCAISDLGNQ